MMYSEFLFLVDAKETDVSFNEYTEFIEPLYVNDPEELDKFRWCARYGKGILALLPLVRGLENKISELEERVKDMDDARQEDWKLYQKVLREREEARRRIGELADVIQEAEEARRRVGELADVIRKVKYDPTKALEYLGW